MSMELTFSLCDSQIKPPPTPVGRFTQVLSVGIGGSALGPQFVAEALAPDNPPLKVSLFYIFKHKRTSPEGRIILGHI